MKYFKDSSDAVYAFEDDGSQDAFISADLISITEAEANAIRFPAPTDRQLIEDQIKNLEFAVTERRMREAILGTDGGWLKNLDAQIANLRAQM